MSPRLVGTLALLILCCGEPSAALAQGGADHHLGPFTGKELRGRPPLPTGRPGNDGDLPFDSTCHRVLLV